MEGRVGREALPAPPPECSLRVWSLASGVVGSEEMGGRRARSGRRAEGAGDLLVKGRRAVRADEIEGWSTGFSSFARWSSFSGWIPVRLDSNAWEAPVRKRSALPKSAIPPRLKHCCTKIYYRYIDKY
jgi:hypothetical protein